MSFQQENILVLSGHVDCGIMGCGAILSKWGKEENKLIHYLVVSPESKPYKKKRKCSKTTINSTIPRYSNLKINIAPLH